MTGRAELLHGGEDLRSEWVTHRNDSAQPVELPARRVDGPRAAAFTSCHLCWGGIFFLNQIAAFELFLLL